MAGKVAIVTCGTSVKGDQSFFEVLHAEEHPVRRDDAGVCSPPKVCERFACLSEHPAPSFLAARLSAGVCRLRQDFEPIDQEQRDIFHADAFGRKVELLEQPTGGCEVTVDMQMRERHRRFAPALRVVVIAKQASLLAVIDRVDVSERRYERFAIGAFLDSELELDGEKEPSTTTVPEARSLGLKREQLRVAARRRRTGSNEETVTGDAAQHLGDGLAKSGPNIARPT
jgi:hypothetical protein